MKKKAIWIIDHGFLVPALVSVRSFLAVAELPVSILFCGEEGLEEAETAFSGISGQIRFERWEGQVPDCRPEHFASVRNRLARMDTMEKAGDELLLMLDADIVFRPGMEELGQKIDACPPDGPAFWAVPDQSVAWQNQFYFHRIDAQGRKQRLHQGEQFEHYHDIFGPRWRYLLGSHGFNNGLVAAYRCQEVARTWREWYLKGIQNPKVNPDDDQRALAAALVECGTRTHILPEKFNSKGEMSGNFVALHALSGRWRMEFHALEVGESPVTDYGRIAQESWNMLPPGLRSPFQLATQDQVPYRFLALPGSNAFWPLYRSAMGAHEAGRFVEVGCGNGKSTCYLVEYIRCSGKNIRFDAVTCPDRHPKHTEEARTNLNHLAMLDAVALLPLPSELAALEYPDESLDFVSLFAATSAEKLLSDLSAWLPKVKPGGVLVGYDGSASSQSMVQFCHGQGLVYRKTGSSFVIEKDRPAAAPALQVAAALSGTERRGRQ